LKRLPTVRLGVAVLATVLLSAYAVGSFDWCRRSPPQPPKLERSEEAEGTLLAGAAEVELQPPYPVVKAGYAPPRPEVTAAAHPLRARALVLQVGSLRVGIASLDVLLIPDSLTFEVVRGLEDLRFAQLWISGTHTHSSLGGFDPRPISEMAGMGRYQQAAEQSVEHAAASALRAAAAAMVPAEMRVGEGRFPSLVMARSEGAEPDGRLTRFLLISNGAPLAQVVIFAAHPTLLPRHLNALDPDFPGLFSDAERRAGRGITLFLQGAVGNVSVALSAPDPFNREEAFANELSKANSQIRLAPLGPISLALRRVTTGLPNPDASRSLPRGLHALGRNLLCRSAPPKVEISELKLASLRLLFVPGEPTFGSEQRLLQASGSQRTIALTNGYLGYIETPDLVLAGKGESRRQYFGPELLDILAKAGRLAGHSTKLTKGK
jgi:neutral ceramidase